MGEKRTARAESEVLRDGLREAKTTLWKQRSDWRKGAWRGRGEGLGKQCWVQRKSPDAWA